MRLTLEAATAIRVYLLLDSQSALNALKRRLGILSAIGIGGESTDLDEGIREASRLRPDVVLLALEPALRLLESGAGFPIERRKTLIVADTPDLNGALKTLQSLAEGFIQADAHPSELLWAVKRVHAGGSYLDGDVTRKLVRRIRESTPQSLTDTSMLSKQERRVLTLVTQGKTNKQIAADLGLSDKTVKNYFSNVLSKLNLERRGQAIALFSNAVCSQTA